MGFDVVSGPVARVGNPQPHPDMEGSSSSSSAAGTSAPMAGYGAAAPAPSYGQPGARATGGAVAPATHHATVPVHSLNPYSSRWTIKVRVTSKGAMREWNNDRGSGKLFSVDLLDESGTEIRGTFFKEGADKFFDVIQEGQVYYMGGGRLKVANKKFTSIKNDYEISFDAKSMVEPAGSDSSIASQTYSFKKLSDLQDLDLDRESNVDLLVVCTSVGEATSLTTKAGRETSKRELTLKDDSGMSISLSLWGEKAQQYGEEMLNQVVAFKGVKVSDYGGRSLSAFNSTGITLQPDLPEAEAMRVWAAEHAGDATTSLTQAVGGGGFRAKLNESMASLAVRNLVTDTRLAPELLGGDSAVQVVKATITSIRRAHDKLPMYPSHPGTGADGRPLLYKLEPTSDGKWVDTRSNMTYETCKWRYVVSMGIADESGSAYVSMYNEDAERLLGMTADELHAKVSEPGAVQDDECEVLNTTVDRKLFKQLMFGLRLKADTYNEETRVKASVFGFDEVNFEKENAALLAALSSA